jgi:tRNA (guanine37-N1)-methyltransferase
MRFDVLTIFPDLFSGYLETSILGRAQKEGILEVDALDIRDFATDKHKTVDDTPYGGGAGMVMKIEPIADALASINDQMTDENITRKTVVLSARGEQFTQAKAQQYAKLDQLVLICGRYEGIDQRVADHLADEELSIGPYVLNGGEVAAMVVIEAVARLVPGVIGNPESLKEESYGMKIRNQKNKNPKPAGGEARAPGRGSPKATRPGRQIQNFKLEIRNNIEYPQYTKPEDYRGWKVPEVLLSGNHARIKKWREDNRK